MIPKWKLAREFDRLKTQAHAIPLAIIEPFAQRRYDARRDLDLRISAGAQAAGKALAIFLVYQRGGVARSVFQTCAHMVENGFAPLVISNTPLSDMDRTTFQELSHMVVERPNFGYDFGGYRDGVWLVEKLGLRPHEVLFLNDSVWFPISKSATLLADMRATSQDYVGSQVFGDVTADGRKQGFFGSYCFLIKSPLWESKAFQSFWAQYRVSSNKEVTLRRGERAFSQQMLGAATASRALFSQERFDALLKELDAQRLWEAIGDMIVTDPTLVVRRDAMIFAGLENATPEDMRELLTVSARSKNYIGAAPVLSLRELGFPMIKKNNERHYMLARHSILAALDEGRLPTFDPVVIEEIRARCNADG